MHNLRVSAILNLTIAERIHDLKFKSRTAVQQCLQNVIVDVSQNPDRSAFTPCSGVNHTLTTSSQLVHLGQLRTVLPSEYMFFQGHNRCSVKFPDSSVASSRTIRTLAGEGMLLPCLGVIVWSLCVNNMLRD